ncbi:TetR family transcriptional regulator [Nonomuraea gerenzanensis]|uniref:Unsaturated fatty acid biosythesis repressor FabR, TetR family n=1 Tax=Nonomuraea gerenzanensis TaxID=93944 RepID=A0A1M4E1K5_9ACTN|nr:TetR family transcriptional regulator [Nonomuraea gerenzanensis]UBU14980.1 TetR family transcriptional regulator [Nonomuraea gerenzanensis]SBO92720.1 Unsaturated fatty acid biosythesis repressor FabR, TetR family [Nonomuraea gerenzanensis]
MTSTPLTRSEAKDLTRRKLIRAALAILDEEGEAGLSTVKVAKAAGIAQSSFYVHFKDMGELLRELAEEGGQRLRASMREARRRAREHPGDLDLHRETFRIPLESICRHPELLRIQLRARHDPSSSLRDFAAETAAAYREHHAADLAALGYTADNERDRRRLEMIADGINAATNALAMGHLEGRYPDLDEAADILTALSRGALRLLRATSHQPISEPPGPS